MAGQSAEHAAFEAQKNDRAHRQRGLKTQIAVLCHIDNDRFGNALLGHGGNRDALRRAHGLRNGKLDNIGGVCHVPEIRQLAVCVPQLHGEIQHHTRHIGGIDAGKHRVILKGCGNVLIGNSSLRNGSAQLQDTVCAAEQRGICFLRQQKTGDLRKILFVTVKCFQNIAVEVDAECYKSLFHAGRAGSEIGHRRCARRGFSRSGRTARGRGAARGSRCGNYHIRRRRHTGGVRGGCVGPRADRGGAGHIAHPVDHRLLSFTMDIGPVGRIGIPKPRIAVFIRLHGGHHGRAELQLHGNTGKGRAFFTRHTRGDLAVQLHYDDLRGNNAAAGGLGRCFMGRGRHGHILTRGCRGMRRCRNHRIGIRRFTLCRNRQCRQLPKQKQSRNERSGFLHHLCPFLSKNRRLPTRIA